MAPADYRRQVHALMRTMELLVEHDDQVSAGELDDLYDDLLVSVHRLGVRFGIDG
jgi:hypothetical protein